MSSSARTEALRLVNSGEVLTPPPIPDYESGSPEALAFLEDLKGPHFASLALTIDAAFAQIEARLEDPLHDGDPDGSSKKPVSWQGLARNMEQIFLEACRETKDNPHYVATEGYLEIINTLHKGHWMDIDTQLRSGAGTGIGTILTIQRNAPAIIRHHEPDASLTDCAAIMRHPCTPILPRKQARLAINHMMAAQSALVGENERHDWGTIDRVLNPEEFIIQTDVSKCKSLGYVDFDGLTVPAGYTPHYTVPRVQEATLATEVPSQQDRVIGCPLTLIQGRLAQLFNWGLEAIEREKLWEEDWPSQAATASA